MIALQDALTANQNWTVLGILAAVMLAVIGLLVWLVKWLCTRFATSVDKCAEVVGESTQVLNVLKERVDELPERTATELQRRKLG